MLEQMVNESILTHIPATNEEILAELWQLKPHKAMEPDRINNDLLKLICYAL